MIVVAFCVLQPANVFLCDGVVKLGDFGLAKRKVFVGDADADHSAKNSYEGGKTGGKSMVARHTKGQMLEEHTAGCGTLSYSAPEQRTAGGKYSESVVRPALCVCVRVLVGA